MSKFNGFGPAKQNWSKLPHQLIDALPEIETVGEMKVIIYTLRHTWGYQDDYKKITLDEFSNGRKRKDGSRIDSGTGLSKPTIVDGIKRAIDHGFLFEHTDATDQARVKKFYSLTSEGLKDLTSDVKILYTGCKESLHRSEKETKEKETLEIMPQSGENDFSDLFDETEQPPTNNGKAQPQPLSEAAKAHLQTFGVLLTDQATPREYAIRQEMLSDNWEIYDPAVETAVVYYTLAVRDHHPDFALPKDTSTRKLWYKEVAGHLANYSLERLQSLYKEAIIIMNVHALSFWQPGSLTKWALPEAANAKQGGAVKNHTYKPDLTPEQQAALKEFQRANAIK